MDDIDSPTAQIFPEYSLGKSDFESKLEASYQSFSASILKTYQSTVDEIQKTCQEEIKRSEEKAERRVMEIQKSVDNDSKQTRATHESNERRGKLILNLLKYLSKKQDRDLLKRSMTTWKLEFAKQASARLGSKIARNYAKQILLRSTMKAWHGITQASWKKTVERRLEREQDYKMAQLEQLHQDKVNQLSTMIKELEKQLEATKLAQIKQQEDMRAAFLRGVSALNAQAVGMFNMQPVENLTPVYLPQQSPKSKILTPKDIQVAEKPVKTYNTDGRGTLTATNGLVTRHLFKKETV